jgi:RNA polymerase sigma factor (sigma-70 family)
MFPRASHEEGEHSSNQHSVDPHAHLRRFLAVLAVRASRLGSRDPESAVQETLKRSLQNPAARVAIEFYFSQDPPAGAAPPEWPLDRLFAWLHGVLTNVVRDENARASRWREIPMVTTESDRPGGGKQSDPMDPAADPLEQLIDRELKAIVAEAFPKLERDYRTVLNMRIDGMKYSDIADRLGVSENTVATWVSRGIRELGRQIRRRTTLVRRSRGASK